MKPAVLSFLTQNPKKHPYFPKINTDPSGDTHEQLKTKVIHQNASKLHFDSCAISKNPKLYID